MRSIAALAIASVAVANSLEDGNHLTLKGYEIPISGEYGATDKAYVAISSYFDVGVFYKFPFYMKWGKEFQSAQELILYAGGKNSIDITLLDVFNMKLTALFYPGQIQLLRNDIYILWPKDTFLDKLPEEADMSGESDNIELTAESDPHHPPPHGAEGQLTEDEWYCMDTKYGYQLGWYLIKLQLGLKGCDFSLYDKFEKEINWECAYSNYYFDKVMQGSLWGNETWGLRYTCPWSAHLETKDFSMSDIKDSIVEDLEENAL
jgi:hypothetical protein